MDAKQYLSGIGKRGGTNGTGKAKRRPSAHYARISRAFWAEKRRLKKISDKKIAKASRL